MIDGDDENVLRENLRVGALSPEALARIRSATEAEWRSNVAAQARDSVDEKRPRVPRWRPLAVAASVMIVALAGIGTWLSRDAAVAGAPLARLERAEPPGVVELRPLWRESALDAGADIRVGQKIAVRGGTLFALHGGGDLRVAPHSEIEVVSADTVRLSRGELYVNIPPGSRASGSFTVVTAAGEFRHLGTQYSLAVVADSTRLRVREGSVQWHAGHGESTVNAGTEVVIDRNLDITRHPIEPAGEHWAWVESMAPEIDIDNRPLNEFLDWVARETGRKLVIADEATRRQVAAIRMHGNVHGLEPLQALRAVMASTSLKLELPAGAIRVSFAGAPPAQHL
jgi:ferric-dicitrate binding protein FerR (iron transport regulator)